MTILLKNRTQLMTDWIRVLFKMKLTPCCCLSCIVATEPKSVSFPFRLATVHTSVLLIFRTDLKMRMFVVPTVTSSFGCLTCVVCLLVLWTVTSVDLFDAGGSKKGSFCRLFSLYFCRRLTEIQDSGADIHSVFINNFILSCSREASPGFCWESVVEHPSGLLITI